MGQCCASVRSEDKLESQVTDYEKRLGWATNAFSICAKQIDIHSATGQIHMVRVPMLAHSLGIQLRGKLLPGAASIFEYIRNDEGWIQRRVAALCALCCAGSNKEKAQYLMRMYGTDMRLISRENMVELVADAVHISLNLMPKGAEEYLQETNNLDLAQRVGRYATLLKNSADDLCMFLLAECFNDEFSFMMIETFYEKMTTTTLKCLCNSSNLRKLGVRLAKQNRDLVPEETCDSSTILEPEDLSLAQD